MKNYLFDGFKDSAIFGVSFTFYWDKWLCQFFKFFETLSTILFVFSTPLQFLLVQSYEEGYILIPLILAMNARFLLMSATLSPYFKKQNLFFLALHSILICPSVFSGCIFYFLRGLQSIPFCLFYGARGAYMACFTPLYE